MTNVRFRLGQMREQLRAGGPRDLMALILKRWSSETYRVGIRRELTAADDRGATNAKHHVRSATVADIEAVLDPARGGAGDAQESWQRYLLHHVLELMGPGSCYVADEADLGPSFMQYLFVAEDNDALRSKLPDVGPPIEPGQGLVDFLYVPPDARTLPFTAECLSLVAVEARKRGLSSLITYTGVETAGALVASQLAGYRPFEMRSSRFRHFRHVVTYEPYDGDIKTLLRDSSAR